MDSKCFTLVNTMSTAGVMGKGIALPSINEFPPHSEVYRAACTAKKKQKWVKC
jgi:hypothetical protein